MAEETYADMIKKKLLKGWKDLGGEREEADENWDSSLSIKKLKKPVATPKPTEENLPPETPPAATPTAAPKKPTLPDIPKILGSKRPSDPAAIRAFQAESGFEQTGAFGPKTTAKWNSLPDSEKQRWLSYTAPVATPVATPVAPPVETPTPVPTATPSQAQQIITSQQATPPVEKSTQVGGGVASVPTTKQTTGATIQSREKGLNPEASQDYQEAQAAFDESGKSLAQAYEPLTDPKTYENMMKKQSRAMKAYRGEVEGAKKTEFWDRIIHALGKVGAGAAGIYGVPGVAKPGLDVASYYKPEPVVSSKDRVELAKANLGLARAEAEQPIANLKAIAEFRELAAKAGWPPERIQMIMKVMETGGTEKTEGVTSEMSKGQEIISPAAAAKPTKEAKDERVDTTVDKAMNDNRLIKEALLKARPVAARDMNAVKTNLYKTGIEQGAINKMIKEEMLKKAGKKPDQKYWESIQAAVADRASKMLDMTDVGNFTGAAYSNWYMNTYRPNVAAYGNYGLKMPVVYNRVGGVSTFNIYDAATNPNSAYNQIKAKIAKMQPKASPETIEQMTLNTLKKSAAGGQ